jgi:hypothetical protein
VLILNAKLKWIVAEEHFDAHPYPFYCHMDLISTKYPQIIGEGFKNTALFSEGNHMYQLFDSAEFAQIGKRIMGKFLNEKSFLDKLVKKNRKTVERTHLFVDAMLKTDYSKLSDSEFADFIERLNKTFYESSIWGTIISFAEYENSFASGKIREILAKNKGKIALSENEIFDIISYWPEKTLIAKEKEELLKIAKAAKDGADVSRQLSRHTKKFEWIAFGYQGPILTLDYFKAAISDAIKSNITYDDYLAEEERKSGRKEELIKKLRLSKREINLIDNILSLFYMKAYRRDVEFKLNYALSFV